MTKEQLLAKIRNTKATSAWGRGVKEYAVEIVEYIDFEGALDLTKENALNGADSWREYSWSGCALVYDVDIAERLCTPSELKKKRHGELAPNSSETWIDVQTRALVQAWKLIARCKSKG